jgi:hypothetical protein
MRERVFTGLLIANVLLTLGVAGWGVWAVADREYWYASVGLLVVAAAIGLYLWHRQRSSPQVISARLSRQPSSAPTARKPCREPRGSAGTAATASRA